MNIKAFFRDSKKYGCKYAILKIADKVSRNELPKSSLIQQNYFENLPQKRKAEALKDKYYNLMGRELDLEHPKTFTEKIQWLKLFDSTEAKTRLADKYAVREWVKLKIGEEYLVPLVGGPWKNFDEIDFEQLPDEYALKCNHGSGMNVIVKRGYPIDLKKAKKKFNYWMHFNYGNTDGLELHYHDIKPLIIAEKYIEQSDGNLYDYKIHCANGKPFLIQLIGNRNLLDHSGKQAFYTPDWKMLDKTFGDYPLYENKIDKPTNLNEMLTIAKKLSEGFKYVRVDLYTVQNKVMFGEMTFTPASGYYPLINPKEWDEELGNYINLN